MGDSARRTVVHPDRLASAFPVFRGHQNNLGEVTDLPAPNWDPNLEYFPGRTWVACDEHVPPTIIYRKDAGDGEWVQPSIGWVRQALYDPRLDPNWQIWPNVIGNLAIVAFAEDPESDHPYRDGNYWYIGFIDVVEGRVELWDGSPEEIQAMADNYPFSGALLTVNMGQTPNAH